MKLMPRDGNAGQAKAQRDTPVTAPTPHDRIRGSLLGGAVGDALGAAIEFLALAEIRRDFGPAGLRDYAAAYGRRGAITDDTQMTLFTTEGVLRAWVRQQERGICGVSGVIHHAYLRWLLTQGVRPRRADIEIGTDGWLFGAAALHSQRAPGHTCLTALRTAEDQFGPTRAANDSKGCGGVMRVAPIGLFAPTIGDDAQVFGLAADAAALTHGQPSGFLAAGYLAVTIAALLRTEPLPAALDAADTQLRTHADHAEVADALARARTLAALGMPDPTRVESLGAGWIAEEALAIAVYCALTARDFADGVLLSVNHSGDSDSTGAHTGNLLGAQLGHAAIPPRWLAELELRDAIERLANDLHAINSGALTATDAWDAYPGW